MSGRGGNGAPCEPPPKGVLEGKAPQRRPQERFNRRLQEVAKAVGGGYCWVQTPLKLALGVRETVTGHRLGALEGEGGGTSSPSDATPPLLDWGSWGRLPKQPLCQRPAPPSPTEGGSVPKSPCFHRFGPPKKNTETICGTNIFFQSTLTRRGGGGAIFSGRLQTHMVGPLV